MLAVAAYHKKSTEYLEREESASFNPTLADFSAMETTDSSLTPELPRHWNREAIERCFARIAQGQNAFAHTLWEAYQTVGFQLDEVNLALGGVRDRLWKIEHSKRWNGHEEQEKGAGPALSGVPAQGPGAGSGIRFTAPGRLEHGQVVRAGDPGADAAGRPAAGGDGDGGEMNAAGRHLLQQARDRYGKVSPCEGRKWEGCLTHERGMLMLWFDTPDHNTHMVYERTEEGRKQ